ncbi:MAG: LPP20 family lipoprotein [Alphaproteobacteria bacterium]|jgi:hypothetical protein|nr:LPP20 family lipoprotein [Alphaproteobacteria bacterium]
MKNFALINAILVALLISGCATKKETIEITECNFPDNPSVAAPLWVCGGAVEGVAISAVGSTPKSKAGVNFMTQQATANGRVVLAQQIQADIQAMVKNFTETTGSLDSETVDQVNSLVSKQITNQRLQGTRVFKQTVSPNGTLYVLVGFDSAIYNSFVKESLNTSYQNNQAQWQRILSDRSFNELEASISKQ